MYDALGAEVELREDRLRAISRNMDIEEIEQQVHEQISTVQENVQNIERMLGNLEKDEKSLEGKIEKRRNELERSEKRLSTLQSVRPAYMDEYEKRQAGRETRKPGGFLSLSFTTRFISLFFFFLKNNFFIFPRGKEIRSLTRRFAGPVRHVPRAASQSHVPGERAGEL